MHERISKIKLLSKLERVPQKIQIPRIPRGQMAQMRLAAVLVPLYAEPGSGKLHAIYIQRTRSFLKSGREAPHSGQIGFPGGKVEAGESAQAAALREAEEEIALAADGVELLGRLGTFSTVVSGFMTETYLGWLERAPKMQRNRHEVEAIFDVPLESLLTQHRRDFTFESWEDLIAVHYHWEVPGENRSICIWGMTGRITWALLELLFFDGEALATPSRAVKPL